MGNKLDLLRGVYCNGVLKISSSKQILQTDFRYNWSEYVCVAGYRSLHTTRRPTPVYDIYGRQVSK